MRLSIKSIRISMDDISKKYNVYLSYDIPIHLYITLVPASSTVVELRTSMGVILGSNPCNRNGADRREELTYISFLFSKPLKILAKRVYHKKYSAVSIRTPTGICIFTVLAIKIYYISGKH